MSTGKTLTKVERLIIAGGVVLGDMDAAYKALNPNTQAKDEPMMHRMALRYWRGEPRKSFIETVKTLIAGGVNTGDVPVKDLTDKAVLLNELSKQYAAAKDAKQASDILSKIADITRMKNEQDAKEEEKLVHFFIPMQCHSCPLYIHYGKAEMERLRNDPECGKYL